MSFGVSQNSAKFLLQFSKGVENLTPTTFNLTTLQAIDGRAL